MTTRMAEPRPAQVHRFEVRRRSADLDARGASIRARARDLGFPVEAISVVRVYLIQGALSHEHAAAVTAQLLADPVVERAVNGVDDPDAVAIEVHPLPGVMDPAAQSVSGAIESLLGVDVQVSTGWRYEFQGLTESQARDLSLRILANPVIHAVHVGALCPDSLPRGHARTVQVRDVPILALDDDALTRLSRDAHLFLSPEEMRAIQSEYRRLGREPREIELETLAQTWSEHCVHKTLKSKVAYRADAGEDTIDWTGRPGHTARPDGTVEIDNLLRSTIAAATHELIADGVDWTLSVFTDNSGVIAFDDTLAVCMKVETHNHPSALEPYGGAATGIGGCIRDVIGTGLGARPIASTDVFCVAEPGRFAMQRTEHDEGGHGARHSDNGPTLLSNSNPISMHSSVPSVVTALPPGCLHPRRILTDVVAGVRDYGNRMGIPTVNGAVEFDDRYVGNPLVFCGCIGVMPRDRVRGSARAGDLIVALGGRTGRDGIHGATFSSAELTDSHADEFSHAVQIGNAIEEKKVLEAVIGARDAGPTPLFTAITDCGAGGFSSAVGEMGERLGAEVHLDRAPLKYAGLTSTEIWISEAQERMVLAVPPENLEALRDICDREQVELAVLGAFGTPERDLILIDHGTEVGRLPMAFLHEGIPTPRRDARWVQRRAPRVQSDRGSNAPADSRPAHASRAPHASAPSPDPQPSTRAALLALLSQPAIASKHWIIRQYDHEVQGNLIVRPLVGPGGRGPGDASVIEPRPGSSRALAIACGLQTRVGDPALRGDPYQMALAAIDECVRNLVCVGADPDRIAILDNFCWPSCAKPEHLAALVRACEGCYDGAKAYRTPFISGKDSLNNQLTIPARDGRAARTIEIPYTLLISGMGIVPDVGRCVTMDAKAAGHALVLIGDTPRASMGASLAAQLFPTMLAGADVIPAADLRAGPAAARAVAALIREGLVHAAHDVSDGGLLVAIAEMLIAGSTPTSPLGAALTANHPDDPGFWFAESPSRYVLEIDAALADRIARVIGPKVPFLLLGHTDDSGSLTWPDAATDGHAHVEDLARAWRSPLDW